MPPDYRHGGIKSLGLQCNTLRSSLIWVCTVCSEISATTLKLFTVRSVCTSTQYEESGGLQRGCKDKWLTKTHKMSKCAVWAQTINLSGNSVVPSSIQQSKQDLHSLLFLPFFIYRYCVKQKRHKLNFYQFYSNRWHFTFPLFKVFCECCFRWGVHFQGKQLCHFCFCLPSQ